VSAKVCLRAAACLGLCLLLGGVGLACPAKDLKIEITDTGMSVLTIACLNLDTVCRAISNPIDCSESLTCTWDEASKTCRPENRCGRADGSGVAGFKLLAIRVLLVGQNPLELRARSRCVPVLKVDDPACAPLAVKDRPADRVTCSARAMNQAIDNAIHGGLTYDGFEDQSDAFPVIALYRLSELPDACGEGLGKAGCARANLECPADDILACAGLAVPVNQDTFDLTCASCEGGPRFSIGSDTGPCPRAGTECFLNGCEAALRKIKSDKFDGG
jgi:hypothetical protein